MIPNTEPAYQFETKQKFLPLYYLLKNAVYGHDNPDVL